MSISEFIGKFRSRFLWGNIFAMAAVVVMLVLGVVFGLAIYTHHGERIVIPDVRHHSEENARKVLEDLKLEVVVADTGYVKTLPAGSVLEQTPLPGLAVKAGRIIYLTINASDAPTLALPDIIENSSFREAKAKLLSMGFKLGEPEFISGEKDWVYGAKVKGKNVFFKDRISKEELIVLVVGNGQRDASDSSLFITDPEYDMPENGDIENDDIDEFEIVM